MSNSAEELRLIPQIRFLWQTSPVTDGVLTVFSEEFGTTFSYGYDGVVLKQVRRKPDGWWRLRCTETVCTIYFIRPVDLPAAFAELKKRIVRRGSGLYVPFCDVSSEG